MKYVHTSLVAKDWRKLADFYIAVFRCVPVGPERDLEGKWVDDLTGIKGAHIRGLHLALPGYKDGPTLEIFSYAPVSLPAGKPRINALGLAHLAFHVDDVQEALDRLLTYGGSVLGAVVEREYPRLGVLQAVYASDPEGNLIEIQNWKSGKSQENEGGTLMLEEKLVEVITSPPDSALSIVTQGTDGPHVVNSWNSYVNITPDGRLLLPAGRMNLTQQNIEKDPRVKVTVANREVQGKAYKGTGFLLVGAARFLLSGPDFEMMKTRFPWARAILEITVTSAEQTL